MPNYYCCSHEDNYCDKKDTCERYLTEDIGTTLFKAACTADNNYVLYIHNKSERKEDTNEQTE